MEDYKFFINKVREEIIPDDFILKINRLKAIFNREYSMMRTPERFVNP